MPSPSFCPTCGGRDLGHQLPPGDTHERLMCRGCGYIHYINPKIIAGCIIEQDGKYLLCQRAIPRAPAPGRCRPASWKVAKPPKRRRCAKSGKKAACAPRSCRPTRSSACPESARCTSSSAPSRWRSPASSGRKPWPTLLRPRGHPLGQHLLPGDPADSRALYRRAPGRGVRDLHGQ